MVEFQEAFLVTPIPMSMAQSANVENYDEMWESSIAYCVSCLGTPRISNKQTNFVSSRDYTKENKVSKTRASRRIKEILKHNLFTEK